MLSRARRSFTFGNKVGDWGVCVTMAAAMKSPLPMPIEVARGRSPVPFVAQVQGAKSMTNRALLLAAMAKGTTVIHGGLHSDDTERLAAALAAFGGLRVVAMQSGFLIERAQGRLSAPIAPIDLGGSATGARFLLAFAAVVDGCTVVTGDARLCERPMSDVLESLAAMGIRCECLRLPGCLPVRVHGGAPRSRQWSVAASASSQFASALVLLASQCEGEVIEIALTGQVVSQPYLAMTCSMLRQCGVQVEMSGRTILVTPTIPAIEQIMVEPDASSLSYWFAIAAVTGTTVAAHGIGAASQQGDIGFVNLLSQMGCRTTLAADYVVVTGMPLRGIDVDLGGQPDVALTLAVIAPFAQGVTRIRNIAQLRLKESDRIGAAALALADMGVLCEVSHDALIIHPAKVRGAQVRTFGDHRMALSFSIPGLMVPGIVIDDAGCVSKSFPGYWSELARWRAHHEG